MWKDFISNQKIQIHTPKNVSAWQDQMLEDLACGSQLHGASRALQAEPGLAHVRRGHQGHCRVHLLLLGHSSWGHQPPAIPRTLKASHQQARWTRGPRRGARTRTAVEVSLLTPGEPLWPCSSRRCHFATSRRRWARAAQQNGSSILDPWKIESCKSLLWFEVITFQRNFRRSNQQVTGEAMAAFYACSRSENWCRHFGKNGWMLPIKMENMHATLLSGSTHSYIHQPHVAKKKRSLFITENWAQPKCLLQ